MSYVLKLGGGVFDHGGSHNPEGNSVSSRKLIGKTNILFRPQLLVLKAVSVGVPKWQLDSVLTEFLVVLTYILNNCELISKCRANANKTRL